MGSFRKKGLTLLKILASGVLIYFVFTRIAFQDVLGILQSTETTYLLPAIAFFVVSKVLSAFRLNFYFHQLDIRLTWISNCKLYLLGMFYNLFLPGGIGGDAYKGYLIKKKFDVTTGRVVAVLVIDRLSGLLLLFVYACILASIVDSEVLKPVTPVLLISIFISVLLFWYVIRRFFAYLKPVFWKTFYYSALVQLAQLVSAYFILKALALETHTVAYLFIFLISSIVAVLPLTIGGIGSREVVFFYGADWLGLDANASVSISMEFFLITAVISLAGIIYHFKKPELHIEPDQ